MKKRNGFMMAVMLLIIMSLGGCGNQNADPSSNGELVVNTGSVEAVQESEIKTDDEVDSIDEVGKTADMQEGADINLEENSEGTDAETESMEDTAESIPEEPEVEMVDFETWAKQEGNEEPCLVIWNEKLGRQDIMPTFEETMEIYVMQSGDKFAVPYNEKIEDLRISEEPVMFDNTDYYEVLGYKGKLTQINITFKNEQGEYQTLNYLIR